MRVPATKSLATVGEKVMAESVSAGLGLGSLNEYAQLLSAMVCSSSKVRLFHTNTLRLARPAKTLPISSLTATAGSENSLIIQQVRYNDNGDALTFHYWRRKLCVHRMHRVEGEGVPEEQRPLRTTDHILAHRRPIQCLHA